MSKDCHYESYGNCIGDERIAVEVNDKEVWVCPWCFNNRILDY